jgi:tetratricopeptide (TPR) repeat protein
MGLRDQALPLAERSLTMREKIAGPEHADVAESLRILGRLKNRSWADYAGAEPLLRRALTIREHLLGPDDPTLPPTLSELGLVLWRLGKYEEGRTYLRRAVAIDERTGSPDLQKWLSNLSLLEMQLDDLDSAEKHSRRALELGLKTAGRGIPVDVTMINLAAILRLQEDFEGARALLEELNAVEEKTWGTGRMYTWGELGDLHFAMGDRGRARDFLDRAVAIAERERMTTDPRDLAPPLTYSGRLLLAEGKPKEALAAFERALRIRERTIGNKPHNEIAETLLEIARARAMLEGPDTAEPLMRRALAMQRETLVPGHRFLVPTLTTLGEALLARGATAEARGLLREAVDIALKRLRPHHSHRRQAEAAFKRITR